MTLTPSPGLPPEGSQGWYIGWNEAGIPSPFFWDSEAKSWVVPMKVPGDLVWVLLAEKQRLVVAHAKVPTVLL